MAVWGGSEHPWGSPTIIGLGLAGRRAVCLFLLQEHRAPEPILPLRLFPNSIYTLRDDHLGRRRCADVQRLDGLPAAVPADRDRGVGHPIGPADAAPHGRAVPGLHRGRPHAGAHRAVRALPLVGLGIAFVGVVTLSMLDASTTRTVLGLGMFCLGLGLGLTNPTITVAVQNAVEQRDMGSATSVVSLLPGARGSLGLAALGAVLTAQFRAGMVGRCSEAPSATSPTRRRSRSWPSRCAATSPVRWPGPWARCSSSPCPSCSAPGCWPGSCGNCPCAPPAYVQTEAEPAPLMH